jgi:hypothetical protein
MASLAVLVVSGCGSSTGSAKLTSSEAAALRQGLVSVRAAASAHDRGRAQLALDRFSRLVATDAAAGDLASQDLQALRRGIGQARQGITVAAPSVATSTTTAVTSTPAAQAPPPQQPVHSKGHGHPDKHDGPKGHGHGKGSH